MGIMQNLNNLVFEFGIRVERVQDDVYLEASLRVEASLHHEEDGRHTVTSTIKRKLHRLR